MIGMNIKITPPKLKKDLSKELARAAEGATYASVVAYANAAAAAVPIWTGYTKALWLAVAREAATKATRRGVTPPAILIAVSGKPWYAPPMPVTRPSKEVLDSPAEQRAKAYADAKTMLSVIRSSSGVDVTITIPEYEGEENYAIQEDNATPRGQGPWNSMVAGRIAFAAAFPVIARQIKLRGFKPNG